MSDSNTKCLFNIKRSQNQIHQTIEAQQGPPTVILEEMLNETVLINGKQVSNTVILEKFVRKLKNLDLVSDEKQHTNVSG